jgi:hypothetical protein
VGKSTVARKIVERAPGWRMFDPEFVGYMLKTQLADQPFSDFQDWPAWRQLVGPTAAAVAQQTAQSLVVVQTVTSEKYWSELLRSMTDHDLNVTHVVLDCEPKELRRRVELDEVETGARQWRLDHVDSFVAAREWLRNRANQVIDTTHMDIDEIVGSILANVA